MVTLYTVTPSTILAKHAGQSHAFILQQNEIHTIISCIRLTLPIHMCTMGTTYQKDYHMSQTNSIKKDYHMSQTNSIKNANTMEVTLTRQDIDNLLDALQEWEDVVEPKELEDNEVGLDSDRYVALVEILDNASKSV